MQLLETEKSLNLCIILLKVRKNLQCCSSLFTGGTENDWFWVLLEILFIYFSNPFFLYKKRTWGERFSFEHLGAVTCQVLPRSALHLPLVQVC